MRNFNYHYNYALNDSLCDKHNDPRLQNSSRRTVTLPVTFHIDGLYPEQCALPIYGFIVPPLAVLVVVFNALILVIFAKPHIRSHTTVILTVIAIADSLNISLPSIIYVYMYTFGHHHDYVPSSMCLSVYVLIHLLPEMFNLISVWATVLLACIRFRCIQAPFRAKDLHTNTRIAIGIVIVFIIGACVQLPSIGLFDFVPVNITSLVTNKTIETCIVTTSKNLNSACFLREIHIWVELFANSFIPCFALITLDIAILYTLRKAELRRESLQRGSSFRFRIRRNSSASNHECSELLAKYAVNETYKCNPLRHTVSETEAAHTANLSNGVKPSIKNKTLENYKADSAVDGNDAKSGCDSDISRISVANALTDSDCNNFDDINRGIRRRAYTDSFHRRCQKRVASVLSIPGSLNRQFRSSVSIFRQDSVAFKDFKNSSTRSNDSYKRLAKESRRTSWMIFAVVALICSHELLYGILFAHQMIHNVGPIPLNFFGCGTVYLYLWQYITYPLIFLIYCFMSAAFRLELRRTVTCSKQKFGEKHSQPRNSVFMSPCTLRKSISLERETKECCETLIKDERNENK